MPDTVIVTIRWNGEEVDFELPAKLPLKTWMPSLALALKNSFHGIRLDEEKTRLFSNGVVLVPDATLEEYGIYDGEYLDL